MKEWKRKIAGYCGMDHEQRMYLDYLERLEEKQIPDELLSEIRDAFPETTAYRNTVIGRFSYPLILTGIYGYLFAVPYICSEKDEETYTGKLERNVMEHLQISETDCIFIEIGTEHDRIRVNGEYRTFAGEDIDFHTVNRNMHTAYCNALDLKILLDGDNSAMPAGKWQRIGSNELYRVNNMLNKATEKKEEKEKLWYNISEMDPDDLYARTSLLGTFGYHKFRTKNYVSGLLYLVTGGFGGIGVLVDLVQMARGRYGFYQYDYELKGNRPCDRIVSKVHLAPLKNRKRAVVLGMAGILISVSLNYYIYPSVLSFLTGAMTEKAAEYADEHPQQAQELMEHLGISFNQKGE